MVPVELAAMGFFFLVHGGWDSRDVIVAVVFDCVKKCTLRTRTLQPVLPGPSSIENGAHDIEKLLLKTQAEQVLDSEVNLLI